MSVTNVSKDLDKLTMTVTAEYDVTAERAWELWNDPRQLERWWGPPTYPATVLEHNLKPGAVVTYYMTGPEGEQLHGWWEVLHVEAPRVLELRDGFGDDPASAPDDMPTMVMRVDIADRAGGGVVMTMVTTFPSVEAIEQLLAMGMEEGLTAAMGQIDAILAC